MNRQDAEVLAVRQVDALERRSSVQRLDRLVGDVSDLRQ